MLLLSVLSLLWCWGVWGQDDGSSAFELKGRFIQITDMHPDVHYLEGSLARTACHRMAKDDNSTATKPPKHHYNRTHPPGDPDFKTFGADFDENDNRTAGHFAVPDGPCDSPWSLINATFEYIDKVWKDKIDFIVWTGDNVRHDNDNHFPRSPSHIYDSNRVIRDKFYEIFKPKNPLYPLSIPIIPSYGNNDVWPHNIFAPGPNYQTRSYASLWSDMIPEYEVHTFERGGYFATEVLPNKLAIVSLNTLYWFGSNAAVDGCDYKSEPGSQQFEWLRVQLTEYRKRGVKAYLTGHVPPGKKFYYPSCYRRYTLWSHAFRDVILGHFYGHNNMDHFFYLDAKKALEEEEEAEMLKTLLYSDEKPDISTFSPSELEILSSLSSHSAEELLDSHDEIRILGAEDYMSEIKEMFEQLPAPPKPRKWSKGRKGEKQRRKWERKVREYEENYQVVQVAPSVIPTYFSGIRVFEYNVSQLAGQLFTREEVSIVERTNWTEFWERMDREIAEEAEPKSAIPRRLSKGLSFQNTDPPNQEILLDTIDPDLLPSDRYAITKMKPKKPSPIRLPQGPHKSSPRGPLYEPQLFTPVRWEVHFVNLTDINIKYEQNPKRSWDYSKDFFRLEYSSDGAPYYMKDMTLATWLDLGRKIGKEKPAKKKFAVDGLDYMGDAGEMGDMKDIDGSVSDSESDSDEGISKHKKEGKGKKKKDGKGEKKEKETFWDVFLRRAFINSGHHLQFDSDD